MTSPRLATFCLACLVFLAAGCTVIRSESDLPSRGDTSSYVPGSTHYSSILVDFGPPTTLSRLGKGMVWLYEDLELEEMQFGLGFSDWPYSLFKINVGSGAGGYDGKAFIFDGNGNLLSAGEVRNDLYMGKGVGFQWIFKVSSLTSLSDVRKEPVQFSWGEALLVNLPTGLNGGQRLDTGEHGFQLMITPAHAGQHTLQQP